MTRRFAPVGSLLDRRYSARRPAKSAEVQTGARPWSGVASHAARLALLAGVLFAVVAIGAAGAGSASAPARTGASAFDAKLADGINLFRREHGLGPLRRSALLTATALEHDRQMVRFGYFQHTSPDGSSFWRRLEAVYKPEPRRTWAVGENLLSASPGIGPAPALAAWVASPEHRATILNPAWRDFGIAEVSVRSAPGVFGGRPTMVVTADFGVR
jgi:uncharacterized protein YkwD